MPETDSLACPACQTPLPPEATGCQICLRPRTRQEIMRGYAKLRDEKTRKRRLPFLILAAVLALGAGGKLMMVYRVKIAAVAGSLSDAFTKWSDDIRNPAHYAPNAVPSSPDAADQGAPVQPEAALSAALNPPNPAPTSVAPPVPEARPAAPAKPKPLSKNAWRVSGTVYDLSTLEPVPDAEITYLLDEKEPATVKTDEKGSYQIDLTKGEGWSVSVKAPGYRRGQILDIDPSYRVRDADERRAALEHISDGDLIPASVGWKRSMSRVRLDLIAVRQEWIDAPQR